MPSFPAHMDDLKQPLLDWYQQQEYCFAFLHANPSNPLTHEYIEELRKIDPQSVQRADFFLGVGESDDEWDDDPETEETDKEDDSKKKDDSDKKDGTANQANVSDTHFVKKVAVNSSDQDNPQNSTFATETDEDKAAVDGVTTGTETIATSTDIAPPVETDANFVTTANPNSSVFVSSTADSMAAQSAPVQVAQSVTPAVPVAATTPANLTWPIILIPMAISVAIFLLLWSVVNGWFERLIF